MLPEQKSTSKNTSRFPQLGFGLGLRSEHYQDVLEGRALVSWFEVISENFMREGGRPLAVLEKVRRDYPICFHGVSLSIGSVDPLKIDYLKELKKLLDRFEAVAVSDHCCWTGVGGENLHDLLPLPYTEEALDHLVGRIKRVQDFLGRRILLENVSSYFTYSSSEMPEWEFLSELAVRSDCGLLLDLNNVYVSSVNHQFDPYQFIYGIPRDRVGQIHLAGHSTKKTKEGNLFLIDTHDHPVCDEVWDLYAESLLRFGQVNTMIEWDQKIPALSDLQSEIVKAQTISEQHLGVENDSIKISRNSVCSTSSHTEFSIL